ncbi:MAG: polysaccharide pyruvyl transferase family protein [Isosphaeraceae bacterium]
MNILFSTTRQWNPGDEFIHRGILNLLKRSGLRVNSIAWNRHPSIRPGNTLLDNSYDELRHDPQSLDYVIFAGTPEWRGPRTDPLYRLIADSGLRCALIGIGGHGTPVGFTPTEDSVLENQTDLITCRDRSTWSELSEKYSGPPVELLPCPSVFHATAPRQRQALSRVGVVYQTVHTQWQTVTRKARDVLIEIIQRLSRQIETVVICNYVDEWSEASSIFGHDRVWYSHESRDYEAAFLDIDCLVAARVHGCLGAIGTGAPAVLIDWETDMRRHGIADEVPVLLKGATGDPASVVETILGLDAAARSAEIIQWQEQQLQRYQPVLENLSVLNRRRNEGSVPAEAAQDVIRRQLAANEERFRAINTPKKVPFVRRLGPKIKRAVRKIGL